jgi:hypothetical protein
VVGRTAAVSMCSISVIREQTEVLLTLTSSIGHVNKLYVSRDAQEERERTILPSRSLLLQDISVPG